MCKNKENYSRNCARAMSLTLSSMHSADPNPYFKQTVDDSN